MALTTTSELDRSLTVTPKAQLTKQGPSSREQAPTFIGAKIVLGCIPRDSRKCKGPGWSCLVMFPEDHAAWMTRTMQPPVSYFAGDVSVVTGDVTTVQFEFKNKPTIRRKSLPIEHPVVLEKSIASALGFESITLSARKYAVDPRVGKFGGINFQAEVVERQDRQIGRVHNEALEFLYGNSDFLRILSKGLNTSDGTAVLKLLQQFLLSSKYSQSHIKVAIQRAAKLLSGIGECGKLRDSDVMMQVLVHAQKNGHVPTEVAIQMMNVLQLASTGAPLQKLMAFVDEKIKPRLADTNHAQYAEVFNAVCTSSFNFWAAPSRKQRLKPGTGTIIADGTGALYGLLLGPVGSIVYGTLFSVLANEA